VEVGILVCEYIRFHVSEGQLELVFDAGAMRVIFFGLSGYLNSAEPASGVGDKLISFHDDKPTVHGVVKWSTELFAPSLLPPACIESTL
jgi:hypothetical protein